MNNNIVYPKSTKLQIFKQSMDNSNLITSEFHVFDNWWVLSMQSQCACIDKVFILVSCYFKFKHKYKNWKLNY